MSINRKFSRLRLNPSLGMPGMPHTWVTRKGVHVSGGDLIEFWTGRADLGQRRKATATVNKMLVFDDHVMVNRGTWGSYVSDDNFIRVVRRASRKNPSSSSGKWTLRSDGVYRKEVAGLVCTVRQSINYAWDWRVCHYGQSQPVREGFGKTVSEAKAAAEIAAQSYGSRNNPGPMKKVRVEFPDGSMRTVEVPAKFYRQTATYRVGKSKTRSYPTKTEQARHAYMDKNYPGYSRYEVMRGNPSRRTAMDWNWGLNDRSNEARRVWPDKDVFAVVWPDGRAGYWNWMVRKQLGGHMPGRSMGKAPSSNAAKAAATAYVDGLGG